MIINSNHLLSSAVKEQILRAAWLVRRLPRVALGKDLFLARQARPKCLAIGNDYGTWSVLPRLLKKGDLAYCFGLGCEISFERALAEVHGMEVHAFDPTPHSLEWLATQELPKAMTVHALGIADIDGVLVFAPPAVDGHVSMSEIRQTEKHKTNVSKLEVRRLSTLQNMLHKGREIALLKMDVEGSEYGVIKDMLKHNIRPIQLLVEFHHRFDELGTADTRKAVNTLKSIGYALIHVSPNGEEMTFVRTDYL